MFKKIDLSKIFNKKQEEKIDKGAEYPSQNVYIGKSTLFENEDGLLIKYGVEEAYLFKDTNFSMTNYKGMAKKLTGENAGSFVPYTYYKGSFLIEDTFNGSPMNYEVCHYDNVSSLDYSDFKNAFVNEYDLTTTIKARNASRRAIAVQKELDKLKAQALLDKEFGEEE